MYFYVCCRVENWPTSGARRFESWSAFERLLLVPLLNYYKIVASEDFWMDQRSEKGAKFSFVWVFWLKT